MSGQIERAAGGLVIRVTARGREVLLIDDAYGKVSFPKGHLEPGETWEDAAIREIQEETGIEARILGPLGRVEYPIDRNGTPIRKQVRFYLLEAIDESDEPLHQQEEVAGAYYLPWEKAEECHRERGYANWSWVFRKADALWQWHEGRFETRWRNAKAALPEQEIDALWAEARPVVRSLIGAVQEELRVTASELIEHWPCEEEQVSLPYANRPTIAELTAAIEHTLLRPEASAVDIDNLCKEAAHHQFPLVCINPQFVSQAANLLQAADTNVCTVIGFPLGATTPSQLGREMKEVVEHGAKEVDMVIPVGSMHEDDVWTVYNHVNAAVEAAKATGDQPQVKVILETSALTYDQVMKASIIALAAGADFIKTSTGFHTGGARLADVAAMRLIAGTCRGVKASGGVRTRQEANLFLRYGANRLGTSSGVALVRQ